MDDITIKVNGKNVSLSEFPADFIKNTIKGMLSSLKGVDEIKDVEIKIRKTDLWNKKIFYTCGI